MNKYSDMYKLMICILCLTCFSLQGQAPAINWQNTIGSTGNDVLTAIHQTSDGGYILGGRSNGGVSGDKTIVNYGIDDCWIIRLDNTGNILWQQVLGGSSSEDLEDILETPDGGFIVGATSQSGISGNKTEPLLGTSDYWVIKLDNMGNIEWQNAYGGTSYEQVRSIQLTSDGGYIVGGRSDSDVSGDKSEPNISGFPGLSGDYWVLKLDAFGGIEWQNTIGGAQDDELHDIKQTLDGGYILGGYSISGIYADKSEACLGLEDYWVVKLDAAGNIEWQNTIGGNQGDNLYFVAQTIDGGFVLSGGSRSGVSGDKTEPMIAEPGTSFTDFWIVKLDVDGSIQWQNTIGGTNYDVPTAPISIFPDGNILIPGYSKSGISADKFEPAVGMHDFWIVQLNPDGEIVWEKTIGGTGMDMALASCITTDGEFVVAGYSDSDVSGDKTESCLGGTDYWVVKFADELCLVPESLYTDAITSSQAVAHWSDIGADGYQIWYRITGAPMWSKKTSLSNSRVLKFLMPAEIYEYQVRSICDTTSSAFSELSFFSTLPLKEIIVDNQYVLTVYPNPANHEISITHSGIDNGRLVVINAMARQVYQSYTDFESSAIDISDWAPGVYCVSIQAGNTLLSTKFIKQ